MKKKNNQANLILAFLVLFFGFSCLMYAFNSIEYYIEFPHLIRLDWGIPLLYGPLIYIYTMTIVYKRKWDKKYLIHFLPYLINLVILTPFFIKSSEEKIQILDYFTASITGGTDNYKYYGLLLRLIIAFISLHYAFKSLSEIKEYKNKLQKEYSNIDRITYEWLQKILYSFVFLSVVFLVASVITFGDRYPQFDYNIYYYLSIFIVIYVLSYQTLSKPELLKLYIHSPSNIIPKRVKHSDSINEDVVFLQEFMLKEKPYLNGELTATDLAENLNFSRHQLSSVLNENVGKNFYDFINEYRAEEFKRRLILDENSNLTLLAIALDSGFNSKTTFNTIFKKYTGLTPSQYKKSIKK